MRQPFIRSLGLVATVLLLAPGMLAASRDGKRTESDPRDVRLRRHAAIVIEVGGYVPPRSRYLFPSL